MPDIAPLTFERLCTELEAQTDLLRAHIRAADMTTPVPTCPDWNLGQLLRHVGGAHREATQTVRAGTTANTTDDGWRDVSAHTNEDPAVLDRWLADGARQLAESLRAAGPDAPIVPPAASLPATALFPARRMAHETLIHRADAALAVGAAFAAEPDVAADAMDEWMMLAAIPEMLTIEPGRRELLAPGRTLLLEATDTQPEPAAHWLVDLTGDAITWHRRREPAAALVRAPLTDLLLIVYRRLPVHSATIDGDAELVDLWLDKSPFG